RGRTPPPPAPSVARSSWRASPSLEFVPIETPFEGATRVPDLGATVAAIFRGISRALGATSGGTPEAGPGRSPEVDGARTACYVYGTFTLRRAVTEVLLMKIARGLLVLLVVAAAVFLIPWWPAADAQGQVIKIGVLFGHTGPFSAAGSLNCWRGAKMMIDYVNEQGGVLGQYKIQQIDA